MRSVPLKGANRGEMPERLNGTVLKTVRGASSSRVRIPVSPPFYKNKQHAQKGVVILI
jgi:hypothetical protein